MSSVQPIAGVNNIAANVTTTNITDSFPDYIVQRLHTVLITYGYIFVLGLLNSYAFWIVPFVEVASGMLRIALWNVFAAVLLALAPKHTTDLVFFEKSNLSSWSSDFVSFNLRMQLITWGFVGFDATAHISEEACKARSAFPRAMFWAICINAALAFGMVLIFLYCLGPIEGVMNPSYPLMAICLHATQFTVAASGLLGALLATVVLVSIGSVPSAS